MRHDDDTQASLIICLLRNYLHYSLYDQADKLVSFARHHYFLGRIKAVQLNYTAAHTNLQQAIRRVPPAKTAPRFYQPVHKFFVIVELLMGDIPDRGIFGHYMVEKALGASSQVCAIPHPLFIMFYNADNSQLFGWDRCRNSKRP